MTADLPCALITGGAGFIGSHLSEHLLDNGWRVTALDNFSTGSPENVAHLVDRAGFRLVEGASEDASLVGRLSEEADTIFHLAAVVGVQRVVQDPVGTVEINHESTRCVLEAALRRRIKVLFTSSSEVYGANPSECFHEDDAAIIGPTHQRRWSYSASKLLDEFHVYAYHWAHELPVVIVRLFNTTGPRQVGRYGMVVPRFVRQALTGEPLTVYGDGTQRRCFTVVTDTVACLRKLAETPSAVGQVFNVGSDCETSILDLANTILKLTDSASPIIHQSLTEAYGENFTDVPHRRPDTTRLRETIGMAPETPLAEALPIIIDDIRATL